MLAEDYAKAVYELAEGGKNPNQVFSGLEKVLNAKGHMKLLPAIVRALDKILEKKSRSETPIVTLAEKEHEQKLSRDIKEALVSLDAPSSYQTRIDSSVSGGFSLNYKGQKINNTTKAQLLHLYQNITK